MATPLHIMHILRRRRDLQPSDASRDAELEALSPMDKLRELAAWELGDPSWAGTFMDWAKACGIKVEGI